MSDGIVAASATNSDGSLIGALSKPSALARILLVFIAAKLVVLVILAVNTTFLMDEYWTVVHGLIGVDHLYKEIWPSKTVLYAPLFRLAHLVGDGAVEIMLLARAEITVVAFATLGLIYLVARQLGRSRLEALFIVAMVLAFRSYIEWAFIARPEPLALLYGMAALWLATRPRGGLGACFAAGLVSGIAFLTLQKAAYLNLALGLALVGDGLARRSWKDAGASGAALVLGWVLPVGAYYLFFVALGADFGRMLGYSMAGPALENALTGHQAYVNDLRSYLRKVVGYDLVLYLLCAAGIVMGARRLLRMTSAERRAWIFTLVIAILVFAHRSPWPYNFVLVVPFLGLWGAIPLRAMVASGRTRLVAFICIIVGLMSILFNVLYLGHDNGLQNQTVRRAEALLHPDDGYFDGIGMVVNRRHAGWDLPGQVISWDQYSIQQIRAAAERGNLKQIQRIFDGAPKVWILTYRSDALRDWLKPYLEGSYVPIYANILLTGAELAPRDTVTFQNWWPGEYRLYRADGTPVNTDLEVDDRPVEGPIRLEKGQHNLRLVNGEETLYFLPADIEGVAFDMTAPRAQEDLFDEVYTY
jgi:hypothetical protein